MGILASIPLDAERLVVREEDLKDYVSHKFPLLTKYKNLRHLSIRNYKNITDYSNIGKLNNLKSLYIGIFGEINLDFIKELKGLRSLHIFCAPVYGDTVAIDYSSILSLSNLSNFTLESPYNYSNFNFDYLNNNKRLRKLTAEYKYNYDNPLARNYNFVKNFKKLRVLKITDCIENLDFLQGCKLDNLELSSGSSPLISPLSNSKIKRLVLFNFKSKDFDSIANIKGLKKLALLYCGENTDLSFLASMNLTSLYIKNCKIKDYEFIDGMKSLINLILIKREGCPCCHKPTKIPPFKLFNLERLYLDNIEIDGGINGCYFRSRLRKFYTSIPSNIKWWSFSVLKELHIGDMQDTKIDFEGMPRLELIDVRMNEVSENIFKGPGIVFLDFLGESKDKLWELKDKFGFELTQFNSTRRSKTLFLCFDKSKYELKEGKLYHKGGKLVKGLPIYKNNFMLESLTF